MCVELKKCRKSTMNTAHLLNNAHANMDVRKTDYNRIYLRHRLEQSSRCIFMQGSDKDYYN